MTAAANPDPLRRLAQERGRILGELGLRSDDERWTRLDAETIAGLVRPALRLHLPRWLDQLFRRLRRAAR